MYIRTNAVSAPGRGQRGILVVAHHGHLTSLFLHMAVGFGHTVKAAGNVIIATHVLHQVFGHSGQAVGILNVFIVIVCVQKCRVLPLQTSVIPASFRCSSSTAHCFRPLRPLSLASWVARRRIANGTDCGSSASLPRWPISSRMSRIMRLSSSGRIFPSRGLPRFLPEFLQQSHSFSSLNTYHCPAHIRTGIRGILLFHRVTNIIL